MNSKYLLIGTAVLIALATACQKPETQRDDTTPGGDTPSKVEAPAVPGSVKASNPTENSIFFEWDAAERASTYTWIITREGTEVNTGSTNRTYITVKTLSSGTTYAFKVKAVNTAGESEWSESVEATTAGSATPGPEPGTAPTYADFKIPAHEEDGVARAFPGAEGGGMYTTGGRGGSVYHVTNLNDNGPGSLRYGLAQEGKRTIVFDVAGTIALNSKLSITKGNVTIAGQTAPGDGICLKNYTFAIAADNVIVRYIRCRMGDEKMTEDDAMQVMGQYKKNTHYSNIIIDHCSISWCTDECGSFYGMDHFSLQWCILSESLRNSVHDKGPHGYGGLWGGADASYHHNLLAHHDSRNPRIDHDYTSLEKGPVSIFNNVVYNWEGNSCYGGESSSNNGSDYRKYNFFNNYYKPGPVTPSNHMWLVQPTTSCSNCGGTIIPGHFYMEGNILEGKTAINSNNWTAGTSAPVGIYYNASKVSEIKQTTPFGGNYSQSIHSAGEAFEKVLAYAGASFSRDRIDSRIADETRKGTYTYQGSNLDPKKTDSNGKVVSVERSYKGLIDTQTDVQEDWWENGWPVYSARGQATTDTDGDGMPDWFEDLCGLNKNSAADGKTNTLDEKGRYTNLEMYLHYLVRDITEAQVAGGTYKAL